MNSVNSDWLREYARNLEDCSDVDLSGDMFDDAQRLKAIADVFDNELARGIHSCHDNCQQPLCVMRRKLDRAVALLHTAEKLLRNGSGLDMPAVAVEISAFLKEVESDE